MATALDIQQHFEKAHARAMDRLVIWLNLRLQEEIKDPKWPFPTPPRIRDIIASGRLLNSQEVIRLPDGSFEIRWPVEYALEVHEGGVFPEFGRYPGRAWTEQPLAELPAKYIQFLNEEMGIGKPL